MGAQSTNLCGRCSAPHNAHPALTAYAGGQLILGSPSSSSAFPRTQAATSWRSERRSVDLPREKM